MRLQGIAIIHLLYLCCIVIVECYQDPIHTALLYGSSDQGYYYVNLYVGTPPIKQSVIIDTASSITTFPCTQCQHCGTHEDKYYNLNESTTYRTVDCNSEIGLKRCDYCNTLKQCTFAISYAEGSSLSGYFMSDMVLFGDELMEMYTNDNKRDVVIAEQVASTFGCTTSETNLFYTQKANGIMGLSPKTNSTFALPNLVDDLFAKESSIGLQLMFAICIGRLNGYMTIGGYDINRHTAGSVYHKVSYQRDYTHDVYSIILNGINVEGHSMALEGELQRGQGTFLDSGSTLVNVYPELAKKFKAFFKCTASICPEFKESGGLSCYRYEKQHYKSFEQFAQMFPTYSFQLENNFTMEWTAMDYLITDFEASEYYCLPVASFGGSPRLILGQVWMRNWDIAFDKSKVELTFVKSNCSNVNVSHSFSEEEILNIERLTTRNNTEIPPGPRHIPKDNDGDYYGEVAKIVVLFLIGVVVLGCYLQFRKRKMRQGAFKQNLQVEDIEQPNNVPI